MIVAMVAMWMVEMTLYQVIDMIAVRNCFMATTGTVLVAFFMLSAIVPRSALCRIVSADRNLVLVHAIGFHVMQVSVVQVIHMIIVLHGCVTAIGAMYMRMHFMDCILWTHQILLGFCCLSPLRRIFGWRLLSYRKQCGCPGKKASHNKVAVIVHL
jgi:hypothetical protein